ncbi:MAG: hypothetical protein ACI3W5_09350 [Faecousia sp.]
MSYCIRYDSVPIKQDLRKKRVPMGWIITAAAVSFLLAAAFVPQVRLGLMQLIFPGFGADAVEALEILAEQIGDGEPIGKALHSFCVQVFSSLDG